MNHPMVESALETGYPYSPRRNSCGDDALGNEVFQGEEILVLEDEFFLVEELSGQTKEVLEFLGATYKIAK